MVRIPTPVDSNRPSGQSPGWFGGFGSGSGSLGGPGSPGGTGVLRHLFRLGLLTILVLMVMRGAANPKVYEPFFENDNEGVPDTRTASGARTASNASAAIGGDRADGHPVGGLAMAGADENSATPTEFVSADPLEYLEYVEAIEAADRGAWIAWLSSASDADFQGVFTGELGGRSIFILKR